MIVDQLSENRLETSANSDLRNVITVLEQLGKRQHYIASLAVRVHEQTQLAGKLRVEVISALTGAWRSPERLSTFEKLFAKVIISLKQGFNGEKAQCFYCEKVVDVVELNVHHEDYHTWNNKLENLHCAHNKCNTEHNNRRRAEMLRRRGKSESSVLERVSVSTPTTHVETGASKQAEGRMETWASTEGERHDRVRVRFDRYLIDVVNGPFAIPEPTRKQNPMQRQVWSFDKLARHCVNVPELLDDGIKLSSVTYKRWIAEDAEGYGPLYIDTRQKPYKIMLKESIYRERCKAQGIPEEQFTTNDNETRWG